MSRSGWTRSVFSCFFACGSPSMDPQEFAIAKYWTDKLKEGYRPRMRK